MQQAARREQAISEQAISDPHDGHKARVPEMDTELEALCMRKKKTMERKRPTDAAPACESAVDEAAKRPRLASVAALKKKRTALEQKAETRRTNRVMKQPPAGRRPGNADLPGPWCSKSWRAWSSWVAPWEAAWRRHSRRSVRGWPLCEGLA